MCTVVILRRPGHDWPLILAANRDEMKTRPWKPPARHWPDRPEVIAGIDELAGGTWLGVNLTGLVAAVMNREGSLGPAPEKRSRGELPLEALDHADADDAAAALSDLDGAAYRPFNLVIADNRDAFWLKSEGHGPIAVKPIEPGVSMITARDLNDASSPRVAAYLPKFRDAPAPDPTAGTWDAWQALMAGGRPDPAAGARAAMALTEMGEYGTISSSLIALPAPAVHDGRPVWLFCRGVPGATPYDEVAL